MVLFFTPLRVEEDKVFSCIQQMVKGNGFLIWVLPIDPPVASVVIFADQQNPKPNILDPQPEEKSFFFLSNKNKTFRWSFEGEFSYARYVSWDNVFLFVDFSDKIGRNLVFRLWNGANDFIPVFKRRKKKQMGANKTQIIKLNLKGAIFFVGVVVKELLFGDHWVTVFCFVVKRNHWQSFF